jgi:hypothetical protein
MSLPPEVSADMGDLVSELETLGATVEGARYDAKSFGDFEICFRALGLAFRVTRDRGQYMVHGPSREQLETAGLWRAFDRKEEFSQALLAWFRGCS